VGADGAAAAILLVAGEASGDAHGAGLVRELSVQKPGLRTVGIGGDLMAAAGTELLCHYRGLAVVGITEVIAHLGDIRRAMRDVLDAVERDRIGAVVLIDYPDFNMTLARRLRRRHPDLPIIYYVSPQVWAWRSGRVRTLARLVDQMLVILPFEEDLYAGAGVETRFVGHPLLDEASDPGSRAAFAARHGLDADKPWLGLLPGSRRKEVERLLAPLLGAGERLLEEHDYEVVIPRARSVDPRLFDNALAQVAADLRGSFHVVDDGYHTLLPHLRVAAVCSGTATLETALAGTPEVVVYKTSWLTYNLGKLLVRISDIALVNVVAGRRGVPELLQSDVTPANIARHLTELADNGPVRERCLDFLGEVRSRLGEPGASRRAAAAVLDVLSRPRRGMDT
jgi:lipid-A-disaccharide synthase